MNNTNPTSTASTRNPDGSFSEINLTKYVNFGQAVYVIEREEIERCNTARLIQDLVLNLSGPIAQKGMGKIRFCVDGYNNDSRELFEIPKVRRFLEKADNEGICWLYYTQLECNWLSVVLASAYSYTGKGMKKVPASVRSTWMGAFAASQHRRMRHMWSLLQPEYDFEERELDILASLIK